MEEKNVHFKLDFKYKFLDKNYSIGDIVNSHHYFSSLKTAIARSYLEDEEGKRLKEFWSSITREDVEKQKVNIYGHDSLSDDEMVSVVDNFFVAINQNHSGDERNDDGSRTYNHFVRYLISDMKRLASERTAEYNEAKQQFASWLNTRPGIIRVFSEYRESENKKTRERYSDSVYQNKIISDSLDIQEIGPILVTPKFRRLLENARPQVFPPGTVVKLQNSYIGKRGKDPFFYVYDKNIKDSERIGVVLKKVNTITNFGQGSREIRVMWFANGQESLLMERCLRKVESDENPAATNR